MASGAHVRDLTLCPAQAVQLTLWDAYDMSTADRGIVLQALPGRPTKGRCSGVQDLRSGIAPVLMGAFFIAIG